MGCIEAHFQMRMLDDYFEKIVIISVVAAPMYLTSKHLIV